MASRRLHALSRAIIAGGIAAGLSVTVSLSASAGADPATPGAPQTVASVTAKLQDLARQNEALTEQYNQAQATVTDDNKKAAAAAAQADTLTNQFTRQRDELGEALAAQYEGAAFSQTGALLTSDSGQAYLSRMRDLGALTMHQTDVLTALSQSQAAATQARRTSQDLLATATAHRDQLQTQRSALQADVAKYQTLLSSLTAAQQTAYKTRDNASAADIAVALQSVHAGSAAAQKAVDFALAQVGKPYVFAASGPSSYDCSGLTMAAWASAGVSLPHFAASQYNYGTHVDESQLQPGDLLFYYHPIDHVTIYIGNGLMVSAPQEGENVKIVSVAHSQGDYVGATRLS